MKRKFNQVYQFKITLEDIRPPIWRRIQVSETYSFWDLHVAIQDAMGWLDYHLHEFEILNLSTGSKVNQKIADYFSMENPSADYIYDFGDYWHHEIQLEKILPREKNVNYPVCIKGKRACPPEDCGGVGGYEDLLKIIKNQISHEPCGHEAFRISDWSSSFLAHMPRGKALLHTEQ